MIDCQALRNKCHEIPRRLTKYCSLLDSGAVRKGVHYFESFFDHVDPHCIPKEVMQIKHLPEDIGAKAAEKGYFKACKPFERNALEPSPSAHAQVNPKLLQGLTREWLPGALALGPLGPLLHYSNSGYWDE